MDTNIIDLSNQIKESNETLNELKNNFFTLIELLGKGTVNTSKAAEMIGCSRQTLYKYVKSGVIPAIKKGSHNQFRVRDIFDFMNHQGAGNEIILS